MDLELKNYIQRISDNNILPIQHKNYLVQLKLDNFEPKVIYDIGCCVLHWTKYAKKIWPNAEFILFDAFDKAEFLYSDYKYNVGVLSDVDDKVVDFYQNNYSFGGNSYYREIGHPLSDKLFNESHVLKRTTSKLETVVKKNNFDYPDFIKMDVQGAEMDIIKGSEEIIKKCKYLIVELQKVDYNMGAPKSNTVIPYIESLGFKCVANSFSENDYDSDYCFQNLNYIPSV